VNEKFACTKPAHHLAVNLYITLQRPRKRAAPGIKHNSIACESSA
jgi:hypothetical protein